MGVKKNVRFFYQGMTNNGSMTLSECVFISSFVVCFLFSGGGVRGGRGRMFAFSYMPN